MRDWFPAGGGLRDEDWTRRHRVLTLLLALTMVMLTVFGVVRDGFDPVWLLTDALILPCVAGAVLLRRRRLSSVVVALGLIAACGGFVTISQGLTEAHF